MNTQNKKERTHENKERKTYLQRKIWKKNERKNKKGLKHTRDERKKERKTLSQKKVSRKNKKKTKNTFKMKKRTKNQ